MRPIADEGRAETAEDDVDGYTDGKEHTCRFDAHTRKRVHRGRATDCSTTGIRIGLLSERKKRRT